MVIFEEVAKSDLYGIIFTFTMAYNCVEDVKQIQAIENIFKENGGELYYIELEAPLDIRLERNKTENRLNNKTSKRNIELSEKLIFKAEEKYRMNSYDGEVKEKNYMKIDNSNLAADVVAKMIKEKFTEWLNDLETTDYIGRSATIITLEEERKYFEDSTNKENSFFITTLDEDKLIGTISLENFNPINRNAVLGIFIGDKEYRSKGYGKEAIELILDFGFNYLNLHEIKLDVMAFNERAIKCYKKCGFKEYGRRRESTYLNGKYYDVISMDILRREFTGNYIKNKNI